MDPAVQADPYPAYDVLRGQAPVYEMPGTGLFLVTSYAGLDSLGAPLARQEMKLAFELLLERWDAIELSVSERDLEYVPSLTLRALRKLPLRFRARA